MTDATMTDAAVDAPAGPPAKRRLPRLSLKAPRIPVTGLLAISGALIWTAVLALYLR